MVVRKRAQNSVVFCHDRKFVRKGTWSRKLSVEKYQRWALRNMDVEVSSEELG